MKATQASGSPHADLEGIALEFLLGMIAIHQMGSLRPIQDSSVFENEVRLAKEEVVRLAANTLGVEQKAARAFVSARWRRVGPPSRAQKVMAVDDQAAHEALEGLWQEALLKLLSKGITSEVVMQSTVTSAVSHFEHLIQRLVRTHYDHRPEAADRIRVATNIGELSVLSPKDLIQRVLSKTVDDESAPGEWERTTKSLGVPLPPLTEDWHRFQEVVQRRHVIIHHGGCVSANYLERVPPELVLELFGRLPKIGDPVDLTMVYVEKAVSSTLDLGLQLLICFWDKHFPMPRVGRDRVAYNTCWLLARHGLWSAGYRVAERLVEHESDRVKRLDWLTFKLLFAKKTERWDAALKEWEKWDSGDDSGTLHQLCFEYLAVMGELDLLFESLRRLKASRLTAWRLFDSPFTDGTRDHPGWPEVMAPELLHRAHPEQWGGR